MNTKAKFTILCLVSMLTVLIFRGISTKKVVKNEAKAVNAMETSALSTPEDVTSFEGISHFDSGHAAQCFVDETTTVLEGVVESTPTYYVEVVDGYITEDSLKSVCEHIGNAYGIQPELLQAIACIESNYKVNAIGSSNDSGLCQIMPRWHSDRMRKLGITDIFDPYSNILLCADIIDELQNTEYGNDIIFVLMAYNMGPCGATKQYESGTVSNYATEVLNKFYELNSK